MIKGFSEGILTINCAEFLIYPYFEPSNACKSLPLVLLTVLLLFDARFFNFFSVLDMNIFVAKLNFGTDESTLREAFEAFGAVSAVSIIHDKFTGKSKGFGFVEMDSDEEGQAAIDALNETELDGHTIVVKVAEPRESRDRNDRGGRGGGGFGGNRGGGGGFGGNRGGGGGNRGGGGGRW
jgi:uncharacterized membrane protein YgcG